MLREKSTRTQSNHLQWLNSQHSLIFKHFRAYSLRSAREIVLKYENMFQSDIKLNFLQGPMLNMKYYRPHV